MPSHDFVFSRYHLGQFCSLFSFFSQIQITSRNSRTAFDWLGPVITTEQVCWQRILPHMADLQRLTFQGPEYMKSIVVRGMAVHTFNSSTQEAESRDRWVQSHPIYLMSSRTARITDRPCRKLWVNCRLRWLVFNTQVFLVFPGKQFGWTFSHCTSHIPINVRCSFK